MYYFTIKEKRLYKNLTQRQLAKKVGVSQSYISKIENNKCYKGVNIRIIDKIAIALDCSGNEILHWIP